MTPAEIRAAFRQCRDCGCWARVVDHRCPGPVPSGEFEVGAEFEHCLEGRPECEEFGRLLAAAKSAAVGRQVKHLRVLAGGLSVVAVLVLGGCGGETSCTPTPAPSWDDGLTNACVLQVDGGQPQLGRWDGCECVSRNPLQNAEASR